MAWEKLARHAALFLPVFYAGPLSDIGCRPLRERLISRNGRQGYQLQARITWTMRAM
jgi:hypothetical protein